MIIESIHFSNEYPSVDSDVVDFRLLYSTESDLLSFDCDGEKSVLNINSQELIFVFNDILKKDYDNENRKIFLPLSMIDLEIYFDIRSSLKLQFFSINGTLLADLPCNIDDINEAKSVLSKALYKHLTCSN